MADDEGPISLDQFVALDVARQQEAAPQPEVKEEKVEAATPDPDNALEEGADVEVEEEEETELGDDEPDEEEEAAAKVDPPRSWSKDDAEVWAKLPAEVQTIVAAREADRDKAVAVSKQQTARLNAQLQSIAQEFETIAPKVVGDFERALSAFETRWGNVDWNATRAQYSSEEYLDIRAEMDAERLGLEQMQRDAQATAAKAKQASELAYRQFVAEEFEKLPDLAPELADPEKGEERRLQVAKHLVAAGYDAETLRHMSAFELTTTWKAMKWDEAQAEAKRRSSLPRKAAPEKPAKAISPVSGNQVSPQRTLQALEARLTKSGSLDDFVRLDVARQELAAKKAQRK